MQIEGSRRRFLAGSAALLGSVAASAPGRAAAAAAPEQPRLRIGFLPITCATPVLVAQQRGLFAKHGLDVELVKVSSFAALRDETISGALDAAHMLAPMPLAMTLGLGTASVPMKVVSNLNVNGTALTLSKKLAGRVKGPADFKGLRLAIPFDYSIHNLLLRYYLAGGGVDAEKDVQLRVIPPPDMLAELSVGEIDGYIVAEPFNQRAVTEGVGYIHWLSREIWNGHPCCVLTARASWADRRPETFRRINLALIEAAFYAHDARHRAEIAGALAPAGSLNQPAGVIASVLTGDFDDGLGHRRHVPDRIDFTPYPSLSAGEWMLTQFQRWGYLKGPVDYARISGRVFLRDQTSRLARELGVAHPPSDHTILSMLYGPFDSRAAAQYLSRQRHTGAA